MTSYQITSKGQTIATVSTIAEAAAFVAANPGAEVRPVVTIDNPCHLHPAYAADYCPTCGTARRIGR